MVLSSQLRSTTRRASLGLLGMVALLLITSAGSIAAEPAVRAAGAGRVITFADQPGSTPVSIFPFDGFAQSGIPNVSLFQFLMWRPLYWTGWPGQPKKQAEYDLAYPPTYSNGGKTLTIKLRNYLWSDGQPVTSRDVQFWFDLLKAESALWYDYSPGAIPDNVTSFDIISASTFSITFKGAYNHTWLVNELSQLIPLPQQAWDRTSATAAIGNYDLTPTGAAAVYTFLSNEAADLSDYTSTPMWKVVDGPFYLSSFAPSTYAVTLSANHRYSGPVKPQISAVEEVPFTSEAAEYDALRAGEIDYGYVPAQDVSTIPYLKSHGFNVSAWKGWGITFVAINFTNPAEKAIFSQLYVRQAMQDLVNQPQYIKDIFHGYAFPTYGPVPTEPSTPFVGPTEKVNPYPYSPSTAKSLLTQHGWSVKPNGTSTCARPGTASDECGAGIDAGAKLSFRLEYASGSPSWTDEMEAMESAFSLVGIHLTLSEAPFNTVLTVAAPCDPSTGVGCSWDMLYYGAGEFYTYVFEDPTGDAYFDCNAVENFDGFCTAQLHSDIAATHVGQGLQSLYTYESYTAKQIPYLWLPQPDYQISVAKKWLAGVFPQDAELTISPEAWRVK